jgi:outer membrane receptor protein involved in Fe transport
MEFRTYRRAWAWISLVVTALARVAGAAEPNLPAQEFHVPAGDATRTLTDFSRQAQLQLLFDYNVVSGHTTPALDGVFTPGDGLRRLLANTDLDFDFVNERTLAVMQKPGPDVSKSESAEAKAESSQPQSSKRRTSSSARRSATVEVVRVTGTYVRDEPPLGEEIISATRADIEATGSATPADFLRTLPQVFGGGPNQDTHIGQETTTNSGLGVGVNLRGLGARATLVLINGRRVAPSGTEGEFVDVENIPLSAIERIDILPDSASATYGADAVGGVVNFVLRSNFDGAETIARGGSGTRGDLQEYLFSQTLGTSWTGGHGLVSFEFYNRGALPAADRTYAVSDLRPLGGNDYDTNLTNPGNLISPATGQTYAIPAGQNGTHLTAADLIAGTQNLQNRYLDAQIIPRQERWSLYGSARQALGAGFSVFSDVLLGHREATQKFAGAATDLVVPSTNPFYVNPGGGTGPVMIGYSFAKDLGPLVGTNHIDTLNATVGLDFVPGETWTVRTFGSYVREKQNELTAGEPNSTALNLALADADPLTAFNPFADGSNTSAATLAAIRTAYQFWLDSQLKTVDLTADGPIVELPGGPLKVALGADWRQQLLATTTLLPGSLGGNGTDSLSRSVRSAFGQLLAPIFSTRNGRPGLWRLELSAAARYENYEGYGSATTPKYGIVWSPLHDFALRGTWSRALRPPTLVDLDASHDQAAFLPVPDPAAPGGMTRALFWSGGNQSVQPERAQSWTAGFDFTPTWAPGLTVDATYFRTVFKGRIQATTLYSTAALFTDPIYAAIITRNPTSAQIDNICAHSTYEQGTTAQCMTTPAGAIVDLRVRNLGALLTDGIDFEAAYRTGISRGNLTFNLGGTWLRDFAEAQTPDEPLTSVLNTQNEPIDLRLRGSAAWEYRGWGALAAVNFTNSYRDTASIPQRRVDAWTTVDLQAHYDFQADASSWLHGLRVEVNAQNVFNVDPPFLNNSTTYIGYDQENANPYGRVLSLQLRKNW